MNESSIKAIQGIIGVTQDGIWGPKSQAALEVVIHGDTGGWHEVVATSFADPADVRAFKRCKANGGTDYQCMKVGDNAVGVWEDSTAEGTGPSVALPPEDWEPFGRAGAHLKKVQVRYGEKTVAAELKDTMPHKKNITNGAGIDLNPDCCRALGLEPPIKTKVSWRWT